MPRHFTSIDAKTLAARARYIDLVAIYGAFALIGGIVFSAVLTRVF